MLQGSVAAPQSAGAALEALGVRQQAADKRTKHYTAKADTNHPTRVSVGKGGLGLSGFGRVCGLVGVLLGGPFVWSPVMGQEAYSYRPFTNACARVPAQQFECLQSRLDSKVQQVRSASEVVGSSQCVCSPLGRPEPVSDGPKVGAKMVPSPRFRLRLRTWRGFNNLFHFSECC